MLHPGHPDGSSREQTGSPVVCAEARRLLEIFGEAVQELLQLHQQQLLAVFDGDVTANRFDLLIHDANERKQQAKYAYMSHLEDHGCSPENETDK